MRNSSIPGTRGRVRALALLGAPVLHTPCEDVTDFGGELASLVEDLFATMYAHEGVGLAADQIGVPLRVFVYDCPDDEEVRHLGHVVNPRLVEADGLVLRGPEGCLSLPGLEAGVERHDHAVVEGFTATGEPVTIHGTGFFARCLQHEMDHLEGKVYADHLTGWRRRRLMRQVTRSSWHGVSDPA
ncbi:peptide deformylase 2 [Streptomyces sp. TUS-ST3]|uniref:peptide deformylase n=1 Tax=unclassified Streptomyces TaxID=2593676 RepID=UPI000F502CE4|nr:MULTISPECIES: peptide deformylase [unclassified Streptomyces]QUC60385.1 peptide deformylase [Streptomyces sp. A2-16]GLP64076.1 peptide deformylase 2 [Streptomyces sp. TUS-ST3]